jgi:outer membrane protein, multidrug efflux system
MLRKPCLMSASNPFSRRSLQGAGGRMFQAVSVPWFQRCHERAKLLGAGRWQLLFILLFVIPAMAAGCTVHQPQMREHPAAMPDRYAEASETWPVQPLERWWTAFGDERLDEFMAEAFAGNLDLNRGFARLAQLAASGDIVGAGRRPGLNLEGAAGRGRQAAPGGATTNDSLRISLAAAYELDVWGKVQFRADAAQLDTLASAEEINALYLSLAAQIADLYFLAVEQRAQLQLTDRIIGYSTDTLARVEDRYQQGLVPPLDVYQSRQNLAQARARRPIHEANLARAEHALAVLAGRFPERLPAGSLAEIPRLPAELPVGLPAQLLLNRPDIKASFLRLQASDERIGAAVADRFPSFNLVGSYGGASPELSNLLGSGNIFWNLLLNLTQPLFDGGRRQAEVERTRALLEENLAVYHQSVLRAMQEVEDALAGGQATAARLGSLEEGAAAAAASLRLTTDRYLQGLSDYLPVLTAQSFHLEAESALLAARRQLLVDRIQLARALGGGWMEGMVEERLRGTRSMNEPSAGKRRPEA